MPSIENPDTFIATLVAAVPRPRARSVVLAGIHLLGCWPDTYIRCGMAIDPDLYLTDSDRLADDYLATTPILAQALRFCQHYHPDLIAVVIIDDPRLNRPVPRESHRELVRALGDRLREVGTGLLDAWILSDITAGQPWASLLDGDTGTLPAGTTASPDPLATQPLPPIRALPDCLEPDPDLTGQVRTQLADIRADGTEIPAADSEQRSDSIARHREQLRFVLTRIHVAGTDSALAAQDLARVAIILGEERIRACLYALATGPRGAACLPMWTQLVRALPAPERTQAAMLLAVTAYTHGDTALATTAIAIARTDEPTNSAAVTLSTALTCSVPPENIRALFQRGYDTATELGIDLD
ncbi:DUF4192 domain-containing protein [Nocardia sp. NPDC057030]|uniref:DUF4192 domain-containing protein n=1 Tax=unclassified Nocardia TaxID=2637762 RepID=UPI0036328907